MTGVPDIDDDPFRSLERGSPETLAWEAEQNAVSDAALDPSILSSGRMGCVVGSTTGSAISLNQTFELMLPDKDLSKLSSMMFFHCVSHSASMNVAQCLKLNGCVMATSAASRPRAIRTRPIRGMLCRASNVYHRPPR